MTPVAELKRAHRATWAAGDYAAVAERIDEAPPRDLLARASVARGENVLDVATGTGNVAIPAAAAGARVVGLDLTPELLEVGRRRAEQVGVTVEWVEGDAEALPFADEAFDRVLSVFGVQFAPRHEVVAGELVPVVGRDRHRVRVPDRRHHASQPRGPGARGRGRAGLAGRCEARGLGAGRTRGGRRHALTTSNYIYAMRLRGGRVREGTLD